MGAHVRVAIAVPLEPELIEPIEAVDSRIEVAYAPGLLPPVRYPNDHRGVDGFRRAPDDERRWREMLAGAEVLFGIPVTLPRGSPGRFATPARSVGCRRPSPAPASRLKRRS